MVGDPVTLTLAGLALFKPFFDLGRDLYRRLDIANSMPEDMYLLSSQLEMEYVRFCSRGSRDYRDYNIKIDQSKPEEGDTLILLGHLRAVLQLFEHCDEIIAKYKPPATRRRLQKPEPSSTLPSATAISDPAAPAASNVSNSTTNPGILTGPPAAEVEKRRKSIFVELKDRFVGKGKGDHREKRTTQLVTNNSIKNVHSSQTRRQPLIPGLEAESQRVEQKLAESATISRWRRLPWAFGDKSILEAKIKSIAVENNRIDNFLQIKQPQDDRMLWPTVPTIVEESTGVANRLGRLHGALQRLNRRGNSKGVFPLSIEVREDEQASAKELASRLGRRDWASRHTYILQRHETSGLDDMPLTIVIVAVDDDQANDGPLLDCLAENTDFSQSIQEMAYWGYFSGEALSTSPQRYEVYHDATAQWSSFITLDQIIRSPGYRMHATRHQILQLARLLAIAHKNFLGLGAAQQGPRLEHIRFYREKDQVNLSNDDTDWDDEDALILRPWLYFGFGEEAPPRPMGSGSAVSRPRNLSLIECGLSLYQLVTGTTLACAKKGRGHLDARRQALANLSGVDRTFNSMVTKLINTCLDPPSSNPVSSAAEAERVEREAFSTLIARLYALEELFSGDIGLAFQQVAMLPKVSDLYETGIDSPELNELGRSVTGTQTTQTDNPSDQGDAPNAIEESASTVPCDDSRISAPISRLTSDTISKSSTAAASLTNQAPLSPRQSQEINSVPLHRKIATDPETNEARERTAVVIPAE